MSGHRDVSPVLLAGSVQQRFDSLQFVENFEDRRFGIAQIAGLKFSVQQVQAERRGIEPVAGIVIQLP